MKPIFFQSIFIFFVLVCKCGTLFAQSPDDSSLLSFDLNSQQILLGSSSQIDLFPTELGRKMYLAMELYKLINRKEVKLDETIEMNPEIFVQIKQQKGFFLPKADNISISDVINSLIFLQSDEGALLAEDFLSKRIPENNYKKKAEFKFSRSELVQLIEELITELDNHNTSFLTQHVDIAGTVLPSKILILNTELSKTAIISGGPEDVAFAIAYIKNQNFPNHVRRVLALDFSSSKSNKIKNITNLLYKSVNNFETIKVLEKGSKLSIVPVQNSRTTEVALIVKESGYITISKNELMQRKESEKFLEFIVERRELIKAPYSSKDNFGKVNILFDGKVINSFPLYPSEDIRDDLSFLPKFFRTLKRFFDYVR